MSIHTSTERKHRDSTIDIIKGFAIILVLITHFSWTDEHRLNPLFPFLINMAVPLFMIASGYVWTKSYYRHGINSFELAYSRNEIIRRLLRVTVPYVGVVIWQLLDPNMGISFEGRSECVKWIINGTMGPGGYYYPVIIQLIFIFPILFFIIEKRKMGLWLCLLINAIYELLKWSYDISEYSYRLLSFRYIFLLAVGIYIVNNNISKSMAALFTLVGGAFIYATAYGLYKPRIITFWTSTCFVASMWIIPIAVYMIKKFSISIKALEIIGEASWHIFLVQMVWYQTYSKLLGEYIKSSGINLIVGVIVCIIVGIIYCRLDSKVVSYLYKKITISLRSQTMKGCNDGQ